MEEFLKKRIPLHVSRPDILSQSIHAFSNAYGIACHIKRQGVRLSFMHFQPGLDFRVLCVFHFVIIPFAFGIFGSFTMDFVGEFFHRICGPIPRIRLPYPWPGL